MSDSSGANRVVFAQFAEALFLKAHGNRLTPTLRSRLRDAGLDLERPLLPAYPAPSLGVWLAILAEELYPQQPREQALRAIGLRYVEGWTETLLGRATSAMFRLVGPRRSLLRVGRAFRTTDNFTEVRAEEVGPTAIRLHINDVGGVADYFAGLMVAGGHLTGAANPRATIEKLEGPGAALLVEWDGPKP